MWYLTSWKVSQSYSQSPETNLMQAPGAVCKVMVPSMSLGAVGAVATDSHAAFSLIFHAAVSNHMFFALFAYSASLPLLALIGRPHFTFTFITQTKISVSASTDATCTYWHLPIKELRRVSFEPTAKNIAQRSFLRINCVTVSTFAISRRAIQLLFFFE